MPSRVDGRSRPQSMASPKSARRMAPDSDTSVFSGCTGAVSVDECGEVEQRRRPSASHLHISVDDILAVHVGQRRQHGVDDITHGAPVQDAGSHGVTNAESGHDGEKRSWLYAPLRVAAPATLKLMEQVAAGGKPAERQVLATAWSAAPWLICGQQWRLHGLHDKVVRVRVLEHGVQLQHIRVVQPAVDVQLALHLDVV